MSPGVYFAILTIAFAEFARIGFDHFTYVGGSAGFFLPVSNYSQSDLWTLRGKPIMFYYLSLGMAVAAASPLPSHDPQPYRLFLASDSRGRRSCARSRHRYVPLQIACRRYFSRDDVTRRRIFRFYYNNLFPEEVFSINRSIELILAPIFGGLGTTVWADPRRVPC